MCVGRTHCSIALLNIIFKLKKLWIENALSAKLFILNIDNKPIFDMCKVHNAETLCFFPFLKIKLQRNHIKLFTFLICKKKSSKKKTLHRFRILNKCSSEIYYYFCVNVGRGRRHRCLQMSSVGDDKHYNLCEIILIGRISNETRNKNTEFVLIRTQNINLWCFVHVCAQTICK